jgi:hypothetical protein
MPRARGQQPFLVPPPSPTPARPRRTTQEKMLQMPSLVWLHAHLGLNAADLLAAIAVAGMATSLLMAAGVNSMLVSAATWLLYLSLYAVGQTFLGFQWDILLLEAGWAALLLAPLPGARRGAGPAGGRGRPGARCPGPVRSPGRS